MANCCCDRFTINEVSEISPGVYQGTVPTECLICDCKTAPFEVDIYMMSIALKNLIDNAIKFSKNNSG